MRKAPNDLRQKICAKRFASNDLRHAPERNPGPALESKFGSSKAGIFVDQRKNFFSETFFLTLLLFLPTLVD